MLVPYHAIVELLVPFKPRFYNDTEENAAYQWVELLSPEIGFESKETIYVATVSLLLEYQIPEGFLCVAVNDLTDDKTTIHNNTGMIVLEHSIKLGMVVQTLKNFILKMQNWEKSMIEYVMGKDLQGLFQMAGSIIGNSLLLFSDTFRLLACYMTDSNDYTYYTDLIRANVSRLDLENDFRGLVISFPNYEAGGSNVSMPSEGGIIARTIFVEDIPRGQVYMCCSQGLSTQGQIALFEILFKWLQVFFNREAPVVEHSKNIEAFLIDLVENNSTNPMAISNRADYCKIKTDRPYCLFVVRFKSYFHDIEITQLYQKLIKKLPKAHILPYNDSILIVNYFHTTANRDENDDWISSIQDILKEANAEMGMATPEVSLHSMHLSYQRAIKAIEYGKRIQMKRPLDAGGVVDVNRYQGYDIYAYETYYIYHIIDMIHTENRMILESSHCIRALAKLFAFDLENKTDNLKLLYCYLINERSASKTATVMHMHRNNVIYRVDRIERFLGIDLGEYHYRFKFLFSYRVIDYYGIEYLKDIYYSSIGTDLSKNIKEKR